MPYAILKDARVVRVKHGDLEKPWRARGTFKSHWERDMKRVEEVLTHAAGLKRLYRSHNWRFGFVEYKLSKQAFDRAACALVMTYAAEPFWEGRLRSYERDGS